MPLAWLDSPEPQAFRASLVKMAHPDPREFQGVMGQRVNEDPWALQVCLASWGTLDPRVSPE